MGLVANLTLTCDKDLTTTATLDNADAPIPDGWLKVNGYPNVMNGAQASLMAYFCPQCVTTYGTRSLVKTAADICPDLTDEPK